MYHGPFQFILDQEAAGELLLNLAVTIDEYDGSFVHTPPFGHHWEPAGASLHVEGIVSDLFPASEDAMDAEDVAWLLRDHPIKVPAGYKFMITRVGKFGPGQFAPLEWEWV